MPFLSDNDVSGIITSLYNTSYEASNKRGYLVHRMSDIDIASGIQVIPPVVANTLQVAERGFVTFDSDGLPVNMVGSYVISSNSSFIIFDGWVDVRTTHRIKAGALLFLSVFDVIGLCIHVEIIKAIKTEN